MVVPTFRTPQAPPPAGVYPRTILPMEEYLSLDAIRAGTLKAALERSAAYAEAERWVAREPSEAQQRGTAVHLAILEPERFERVYGRLPDDYNGSTTRGREAKAAIVSRGLLPLKAAAWEACQHLRDRAWAVPLVRDLLEQSETEATAVWDAPHGFTGAARADVLARPAQAIVDLKTTGDASPRAFARTACDYGYHLSAPWYLDGFSDAGCPVAYWWIIALEADDDARYYDVALYTLDALAIGVARRRIDLALQRLAAARKAPERAGYPKDIRPLLLPAWALNEESEK